MFIFKSLAKILVVQHRTRFSSIIWRLRRLILKSMKTEVEWLSWNLKGWVCLCQCIANTGTQWIPKNQYINQACICQIFLKVQWSEQLKFNVFLIGNKTHIRKDIEKSLHLVNFLNNHLTGAGWVKTHFLYLEQGYFSPSWTPAMHHLLIEFCDPFYPSQFVQLEEPGDSLVNCLPNFFFLKPPKNIFQNISIYYLINILFFAQKS